MKKQLSRNEEQIKEMMLHQGRLMSFFKRNCTFVEMTKIQNKTENSIKKLKDKKVEECKKRKEALANYKQTLNKLVRGSRVK